MMLAAERNESAIRPAPTEAQRLSTHDSFERRASGWTAQLRRDGYCVVPALLSGSDVEALDHDLSAGFATTPFCTGDFYGERTKRFGGLLTRSDRAAAAVGHPLVLEIVEQILGPSCDSIQLNLTQAIAIHPGAEAQLPHRDQDMWGGPKGEFEYLVNVMWPFTPYTERTGATRLWPGSHGEEAGEPIPRGDPIAVACEAGSALLFLGSTLHGGGANRSDEVRRGMIVSYCLGWLKPFENQWLVYPPVIARDFPPNLAGLVGYRQHRPNLGNVEGRCPSLLLGPDLGNLGAADALSPSQAAALAEYVARQRRQAS